MNHRERVLKTFNFEKTDRTPCDLMEGFIWPELAQYFEREYGLSDKEEILSFLDVDFRWLYVNEKEVLTMDIHELLSRHLSYSDHSCKRLLADVHTVKELHSVYNGVFDPDSIILPDYKAARERWPDHAIILLSRIPSLFMSSCTDFGMEECLVKMVSEPEVLQAYLDILHRRCMDMIPYVLEGAKQYIDICWLMDDVASQDALIMNPQLWRKYFKPLLAEQIELIKRYCQFVIFHSCGSIRSILPDLIEIGVNAVLVFQTSARNMEVESIAEEFGGKIVFYGGVDVQNLLRLGSPRDVAECVKGNIKAFEPYGGYITANSHHCIGDIKGENIISMCRKAQNASDSL